MEAILLQLFANQGKNKAAKRQQTNDFIAELNDQIEAENRARQKQNIIYVILLIVLLAVLFLIFKGRK